MSNYDIPTVKLNLLNKIFIIIEILCSGLFLLQPIFLDIIINTLLRKL